MYKLVAVAGKLRGQEFMLKEGENIIGRDESCDIQININGVSKKHLSITVADNTPYLQDLGSANGTFINGRISKRATLEAGDKIAMPDLILTVVKLIEKKVIIKKEVERDDYANNDGNDNDDLDENKIPDAPKSLVAKPLWLFRYKFMPIFHGINEEYEWKVLLGIMMAVFVFTTISLTIFPVMQDGKRILLFETAKRGAHYADEIARMNRVALEQKKLDRVDTGFLKREEDVTSYVLFDLEGRIVNPVERRNDYISDNFSVEAKNWATSKKKNQARVYKKTLSDGEIGIAQKIMAYNPRLGVEEMVGIIAIRFSPLSLKLEATKSSVAFLEALATSVIVGIFFFGIIYYLTIKPIDEFKKQVEDSLRGKRNNIELKYLMEEFGPLVDAVNSVFLRLREFQVDASDNVSMPEEDDAPYLSTLSEFMIGAGNPVMILNSEKNLESLNTEAEDLTGIRETASRGESLLDVAKEKGFAATIIELCDQSANNGGTNQEGHYELQGYEHAIHVTALIGKDGFAKGFYITYLREG